MLKKIQMLKLNLDLVFLNLDAAASFFGAYTSDCGILLSEV